MKEKLGWTCQKISQRNYNVLSSLFILISQWPSWVLILVTQPPGLEFGFIDEVA
jgi:hypothetical protein